MSVTGGDHEPISAKPAYRLPDIAAVFDTPATPPAQIEDDAQALEDALYSFGAGAKITRVARSARITRYEIKPDRGVRIARILSLADDLAVALGANSLRIEGPVPGTSSIGIAVPNPTWSAVAIRHVLQSVASGIALPVALGEDITGRPVVGDLARLPHLLVAGTTGSGKSVCLNVIIASLLATRTPNDLELLLIDTTRVEMSVWSGAPHLKSGVVADASSAAGALAMVLREADQRAERFSTAGLRNVEQYNAKVPTSKLPYLVVVIDELADLMLVAPADVGMLVSRIAQVGRPAGIHVVASTALVSSNIMTGSLKANMPSRIALAVPSRTDSRAILDTNGAECLRGRGDMLYLPIDAAEPMRLQGALVSRSEIDRLVAFWRAQAMPALRADAATSEHEPAAGTLVDELWYEAATFLLDVRMAKGEARVGSTAALQARFSIGHPRAVRLMRWLEEVGVVGPSEGIEPRAVMIEKPADLARLADRIGRPARIDG